MLRSEIFINGQESKNAVNGLKQAAEKVQSSAIVGGVAKANLP